ncbi:MAG: ATP-dependent metallopeptidase FtsH/Yme1/Tma family protein, partial [Gammaproteobacteria bacterium]
MNDIAKNLILWVVIAIVLMSVFNNFGPRQTPAQPLEYSQFIADVKEGKVQKVSIEDRTINGIMQGGERFSTYSPG